MRDRCVETRRLIRAQQLPHGEYVGQGFLLELSHRLVRSIDCLHYLGSVPMLGFDGFGELCIVCPELELEGMAPDCEATFQQCELGLLAGVEIQMMVEQAV